MSELSVCRQRVREIDAIVRLGRAVLAEQHDEWLVGRRYLADESLRLVSAHAPATTTHPQGKEQEQPIEQLPAAV